MKNFNALITEFNFNKVHKVMNFINFTWTCSEANVSYIPTIDDLELMAFALKYEVDKALRSQEDTYVRSGGLCLYGKIVNNQFDYRLVFELESQG